MDPNDIPKRSRFWFSAKKSETFSAQLLDKTSVIICLILAVFSFVLFWPVISQIEIKEAFFTPLVPFLLYLFSLAGLPAAVAMQVFFIVSFMVSTVGIYLFVRELTKRQLIAVISTLIYLIPPVPVFILTYFRKGLLVKELEGAIQFLFIIYGDGAHFIALAMIPFAAIFFLRYLKSDHRLNLFLCVIFCALIFLATRSQAMSLILILASIVLSEIFLGMARLKVKRFLIVLALLFGLVSFWYTPDFIVESIILYRTSFVQNIGFLFPAPMILGILMLIFTFVIFGKNERRQPIFISFLLFTVFLVVIGSWMLYQKTFVPHAQRLIANLNMFTAMVVSIGVTSFFDKLRITERLRLTKLSYATRSLIVTIFWPLIFFLVGFGVYSMSPLILELFAGPGGIWSKISVQVIADRQNILNVAGSNFALVPKPNGLWQTLGVFVSAATFVVLMFATFGNKRQKVTEIDHIDELVGANKDNEVE